MTTSDSAQHTTCSNSTHRRRSAAEDRAGKKERHQTQQHDGEAMPKQHDRQHKRNEPTMFFRQCQGLANDQSSISIKSKRKQDTGSKPRHERR
ncbi:MAG: hypothetical protein IKK81_07250 [Prevotella sp.]|nr:hypothetical protein [Prevotella sp.]